MQLISNCISKESELTLTELKEILSIEHDSITVIDLMKDYCLRSPSLEIQKKGMEFLYMNGFTKELEFLIHKNLESPHVSNRQWASVYQTTLDRKMKKYPPHQIIEKLDRINTDDEELTFVIEITKASSYVDRNEFSKLGSFLDFFDIWSNRVSDSVFRGYLNIRREQMMMYFYFTRNVLIQSRRYAYRLLKNRESPSYTRIIAHTQLGFSYLFESYFQAIDHMQQALRIAKEKKYYNAIDDLKNRNIPFIAAHFNQVENMTTEDKSEQAHIEIAKGNNQKAIEILNELPLDTPFQLYYMGKAKQDEDLLHQSIHGFIERSDFFFSRLPMGELKK